MFGSGNLLNGMSANGLDRFRGLSGSVGTMSTWALDSNGNVMYTPDGKRIQIDIPVLGDEQISRDTVIQRTREILGSPDVVVKAESAAAVVIASPAQTKTIQTEAQAQASRELPQYANMPVMLPQTATIVSSGPSVVNLAPPVGSAAAAAAELTNQGAQILDSLQSVTGTIVKKPGSGSLLWWAIGAIGVYWLLKRKRGSATTV